MAAAVNTNRSKGGKQPATARDHQQHVRGASSLNSSADLSAVRDPFSSSSLEDVSHCGAEQQQQLILGNPSPSSSMMMSEEDLRVAFARLVVAYTKQRHVLCNREAEIAALRESMKEAQAETATLRSDMTTLCAQLSREVAAAREKMKTKLKEQYDERHRKYVCDVQHPLEEKVASLERHVAVVAMEHHCVEEKSFLASQLLHEFNATALGAYQELQGALQQSVLTDHSELLAKMFSDKLDSVVAEMRNEEKIATENATAELAVSHRNEMMELQRDHSDLVARAFRDIGALEVKVASLSEENSNLSARLLLRVSVASAATQTGGAEGEPPADASSPVDDAPQQRGRKGEERSAPQPPSKESESQAHLMQCLCTLQRLARNNMSSVMASSAAVAPRRVDDNGRDGRHTRPFVW